MVAVCSHLELSREPNEASMQMELRVGGRFRLGRKIGSGSFGDIYLASMQMELRVGGRFRLGRKIGSGSFGDIYLGLNVQTNEEVAVKLECVKSKHPQLHIEGRLYRVMSGGVGIPDTSNLPNNSSGNIAL
ncbi:hypothetical protein ANCCEY_13877 [Ancylostoma ceylanicum]|uniref:Protein kinase domain-containing protein n=1 Tax=Ancylostoma ceylanicum TaxID=53326 RepID=A0A0D6L6I6_9BILA|nr:hypothetical protein ANCCEY_13877 [Ancylostoma ceylanicum]